MEQSEQPVQTKVKTTEQNPQQENGFITEAMLEHLNASGNNPLLPLAKVVALRAKQPIVLKEAQADIVSVGVSEDVLAKMNIIARSPVIQKLWFASTGLPASEEEFSDEGLSQTNWQQKERDRARAFYYQQRALFSQKKSEEMSDPKIGEDLNRDGEISRQRLTEFEQRGIKPFTPKEIENLVKFEAAQRSHSF